MSNCDFSIICYIVSKLIQLSSELLENGNKFPLSQSERAIKYRGLHMNVLDYYMNQINTNTYNN